MPRTIRTPRPAAYLPERVYQAEVKRRLDQVYGEVVVQWQPFRGGGRASYAPVVDVAVGPFAIDRTYIDEYTHLLDGTRCFIESLIQKHNANIHGLEQPTLFEVIRTFNNNARCLLCIEIEESG